MFRTGPSIGGKFLQKALPPPGAQRRYAIATLIDAAGTGLFISTSVIFLVRMARLSPNEVGIGFSVASLVGVVSATPLGHLGDRYGQRRVLIILNAARALLFIGYLFIHAFIPFVAIASLIMVAETGAGPVRRAYLSRIVDRAERVRVSGYNRSVFNLGIALGTLGAGTALAVNTWPAYAVAIGGNAASFALSAVILLGLPADAVTLPAGGPGNSLLAVTRFFLSNVRYFSLSLMSGALYINGAVLSVGIPLWIIRHTNAPRWTIAGAMLVNTLMAVALQVRFTRGTETVSSAARSAMRAGLALLAGCLVCGMAGYFSPLESAAILFIGIAFITTGELLSSAAGWAVSYELAPPDRQGLFLGTWATGSQLMQAIGPVVVTYLVVAAGAAGWVVLGLGFMGVGLLVIPTARWASGPGRAEGLCVSEGSRERLRR